MKKLILPNGTSSWGAQMGRKDILPVNLNETIKLRLQKLKWVDGDYDQWGAYWGNNGNDNVYCAFGEDLEYQIFCFVRGKNRKQAKKKVVQKIPGAKFYC